MTIQQPIQPVRSSPRCEQFNVVRRWQVRVRPTRDQQSLRFTASGNPTRAASPAENPHVGHGASSQRSFLPSGHARRSELRNEILAS
jgi:hypothetical protein